MRGDTVLKIKCAINRFLTLLTIFSLLPLSHYAATGTARAGEGLDGLIDNGGFGVVKNGRIIAAANLDKPFVPASTIKIATALAALDLLGPTFRFATGFYRDSRDNLYIKGYGDPFLISEEVGAIAAELKQLGCAAINDIYLDDTAFALVRSAPGSGVSANPYDAQNSALAVNFNTIYIEKNGAGRVVSAETQTPTLGIMTRLATGLGPGEHRINISRSSSLDADAIGRYVGELFAAFLQRQGIAVAGRIAAGHVPDDATLVYQHRSSRTLLEMIAPLMLYSNNFVANQIFLALGAGVYGYPATWEKSRQAMANYLNRQYGLAAGDIRVREGSGLSRQNSVTVQAMLQLLDGFRPYAENLPRENGALVKSGTLTGVYAYAGYFVGNEGLAPFVLLLNQERNTRDKVLEVLRRRYDAD